MDSWSALEILGLEHEEGLTKDRVRRTYMRRLREHPPERDPDGFRRLREAYESVRHLFPDPIEHRDEVPARIVVVEPPQGESSAAPRIIADVQSAGSYALSGEQLADDRRSARIDDAGTRPDIDELGRPAMSLDTLTDQILVLLEHDEVDEALTLEYHWRQTSETDDHRRTSELTAVRWALTRELLGVAAVLPTPVVQALARGIAANDISAARPALRVWRRQYPVKAGEVASVLSRRAKDLYQQVKDTLAYEAPLKSTAQSSRRRSRYSGGWFVLAGVLMIVRFAGDDCNSSSDPQAGYVPSEIKLDPDLPQRIQRDLALSRVSQHDTFESGPPPLVPDAPRETLIAEIKGELFTLRMRDLLSPDEASLAELLEGYLRLDSCDKVRDLLAQLERDKSAGSDTPAVPHMVAIRARIELVCPTESP